MKRSSSGTKSPKEPKGDKLEFDGVVREALPNAMFRVKADNGLEVLATVLSHALDQIHGGDHPVPDFSTQPGDEP